MFKSVALNVSKQTIKVLGSIHKKKFALKNIINFLAIFLINFLLFFSQISATFLVISQFLVIIYLS